MKIGNENERLYSLLHTRNANADPVRHKLRKANSIRQNWGILIASLIILGACVIVIADAMKGGK